MNSPQPDPKKLLESLVRLKGVFESAAADSRGAAQPLLQNLSDNFNRAVEPLLKAAEGHQKPDVGALMLAMVLSGKQMQTTMLKMQNLAQKDPDVAAAVQQLEIALREVIADTMGGVMPSLPPAKPNNNQKPPAPPAPRPKKWTDNDSFDL